MQNNLIELTNEKFQEIYTNESFRNEVAWAHSHCDSSGKEKYKATCSYPTKYITTEEQIKEAKKEQDRRKVEVLEETKNALVFVSMGMSYEPKFENDVCSYRVRTEFLNVEGNKYFIEFSSGRGNGLLINHSIDRTFQEKADKDYHEKRTQLTEDQESGKINRSKFIELLRGLERPQSVNFQNLERCDTVKQMDYTTNNLMDIVNEYFNCNFKKVVIDEYNLSCDDVLCQSPKVSDSVLTLF